MNSKVTEVITKGQKQENLDQILKVMDRFSECDMTHLDLELDGIKLKLKKEKEVIQQTIVGAPAAASASAVQQVVTPVIETQTKVIESAPKPSGQEVKAPLVGTYYVSNAPGAKAFASVGDTVKKGQVICIIEAMKVMNEIESPCDGIVKEILVGNEDAIGFDQVLMIIE